MVKVDKSCNEAYYVENIHPLVAGDVIIYLGMQFETLVSILDKYTNGMVVFYVAPGTGLYTSKGARSAVVVSPHKGGWLPIISVIDIDKVTNTGFEVKVAFTKTENLSSVSLSVGIKTGSYFLVLPATINETGLLATAIVEGLQPGIKYYLQVKATNGRGTVYSMELSQETIALPPPDDVEAPTDLKVSATGETSITLEWVNNDYDATVLFEHSTDGVNYEEALPEFSDSNFYTCEGLSTGSKYFFRVRAVKGSKYSDYSNVVTAYTAFAEVGPGFLSTGIFNDDAVHNDDSIPVTI